MLLRQTLTLFWTLTSTSLRAMLLKVTRFNWLASVPSNFVTVLLVRVVTHKLVRKLKLLHQTFQHSSQVRASRMKLTSNNLLLQKKTASFLVVFYFASEPAINKTFPCSVSIISQSMPKFCLIACAVITSSGLPCF